MEYIVKIPLISTEITGIWNSYIDKQRVDQIPAIFHNQYTHFGKHDLSHKRNNKWEYV